MDGIFLVERTEVEPFDRIAGIEWNAVEFYRFVIWLGRYYQLRYKDKFDKICHVFSTEWF